RRDSHRITRGNCFRGADRYPAAGRQPLPFCPSSGRRWFVFTPAFALTAGLSLGFHKGSTAPGANPYSQDFVGFPEQVAEVVGAHPPRFRSRPESSTVTEGEVSCLRSGEY